MSRPYPIRIPHRLVLGVLTLIAIGLAPLHAAQVDFGVEPGVIELGETATIHITVQGAGRAASPGALPLPDGLTVIGQNQNMQVGPGGSVMRYNYSVVARQPGTFTIGPFTYRVGAETFELPAQRLEVKPAGTNPARTGEARISDVLFVEMESTKPAVVTQEPFDLVLSLFSHPRVSLADEFALQNMDITGIKFGQWQRLQTERVTRDGQLWNVRRFRVQARPLSQGRFTMRPGLEVRVLLPRRDPFGDNFFDLAGFGFQEARPVQLQAAAETVIEVSDVPAEGRPAGYAGAVGSFQFHADASPAEVTAGDPVTLRVAISGKGNLDTIGAPEPALDARFKAYEAKAVTQELNESGTAGKKVFEKVLIPLSAGVQEIPAVSFSYYDPEQQAFRTATAGPFALRVKAGTNTAARVLIAPSGAPGAERAVVGEDIVYLKPAPAAWTPVSALSRPVLSGPALWLQAVPLALLGAACAVARRRRRMESDVGYARRREAPRHARAGIRKAREAARSGDAGAFHAAVWQAVSGYFANRLNAGAGEISAELLRRRLDFSPDARAVAERTIAVIERCEAARFGGAADGENLDVLLAGVENLLRDAERVKGDGT